MRFFIPNAPDKRHTRPTRALELSRVPSMRFECENVKSKFLAEVRQPRQECPRSADPRGGYIKDAGYSRMPRSTESIVNLIIEIPGAVVVYSAPVDGWALPSIVGVGETVDGTVEYFDSQSEDTAL